MVPPQLVANTEKDRFDKYEIRVIRPRYFIKRQKFELGATGTMVTNQTFIYTYMLSGLLTYHFTETLGFELGGTYGFSVDKDDKRILESENFGIKTQILRTEYILGGSLLWTPIYGKYQLAGGRVIYFDTYLLGGVGQTGIDYLYDHCVDPTAGEAPARTTMSYPTLILGAGQRYFVNKDTGLNWSIRNHKLWYNSKDGACPGETGEDSSQDSITIHIGMSKFF
jgi:outer membrane beta-barrel protein